MDARKLQRTGGSTFTVSLPKRWVTSSGLHAGDTVFIDSPPDGSLVVRAKPVPASKRSTIVQVKDGESRDHLLRKFIGAYISGFALIEVRFKPEAAPAVRAVARAFTRMVIGPEILEETRTSLVLQDLSDPTEMSAEKCLRRMYMTVRAMHEDALEAIHSRDATLAQDVVQRDEDVDRLYWMVAKQYSLAHQAGAPAYGEQLTGGIHNYWLVAKLLERIGDHGQRIASAALTLSRDLEARLVRDLQAAGEAARAVLDGAFTALMADDVDRANAAVDQVAGLQKLADALTHRVAAHKGEELLALGAVVDSITRTGGYAADIAEIAINQIMARKK